MNILKPDYRHWRCTKRTLVSQASWVWSLVPDGDTVYDVFIAPVGDKRTDAASRAFHAMVDEYVELTGEGKEHAKQRLKVLYGVAEPMSEFRAMLDLGEMPDKRPGQFVELDENIYYVISTTAMTAEEMARLCRGVEHELGGIV